MTTKKSKFSSSPRLMQSHTILPGPGDYELKEKKGMVNEKCKFGTSLRLTDSKFVTPSPVDYSQRSAFDYNKDLHKGKSMGKRYAKKCRGQFQYFVYSQKAWKPKCASLYDEKPNFP